MTEHQHTYVLQKVFAGTGNPFGVTHVHVYRCAIEGCDDQRIRLCNEQGAWPL